MRSKKWIVMVEDDMDMHYLYKRVFSNLHLEERLKLFDNAADALQFLHEAPADTEIIFSDINMPVVDGLELKRRINEDKVLAPQHIPFVFLSTSATASDIKKSATLDIQGFFQKGETLTDIEKTIDLVITYWHSSINPAA